VVPEPTPVDARAAASLARDIAARELAPHVAAWDGAVPPAAATSLREAGLLDPDLPHAVRAEVAREAGRAGCAAGLAVAATDDLTRAAVLAGAAETLAGTGMAYARERVVFGRPLARMPVQRYAFATVAARVEAAVALVRRVAAARDAGTPHAGDEAAVLPYALDAAWAAAEAALQVHGGNGYTDDYPVSRMWREVVAARAALGGPEPGL
jgi:alkylation response protein AidB-like acyl-CoA dehydrogenase